MVPSTANNDTISRIVLGLSPGTHVGTIEHDIDYVVSEYGVAQLRGKAAKQRASELIAIAHPDFRAELREQAKKPWTNSSGTLNGEPTLPTSA